MLILGSLCQWALPSRRGIQIEGTDACVYCVCMRAQAHVHGCSFIFMHVHTHVCVYACVLAPEVPRCHLCYFLPPCLLQHSGHQNESQTPACPHSQGTATGLGPSMASPLFTRPPKIASRSLQEHKVIDPEDPSFPVVIWGAGIGCLGLALVIFRHIPFRAVLNIHFFFQGVCITHWTWGLAPLITNEKPIQVKT